VPRLSWTRVSVAADVTLSFSRPSVSSLDGIHPKGATRERLAHAATSHRGRLAPELDPLGGLGHLGMHALTTGRKISRPRARIVLRCTIRVVAARIGGGGLGESIPFAADLYVGARPSAGLQVGKRRRYGRLMRVRPRASGTAFGGAADPFPGAPGSPSRSRARRRSRRRRWRRPASALSAASAPSGHGRTSDWSGASSRRSLSSGRVALQRPGRPARRPAP